MVQLTSKHGRMLIYWLWFLSVELDRRRFMFQHAVDPSIEHLSMGQFCLGLFFANISPERNEFLQKSFLCYCTTNFFLLHSFTGFQGTPDIFNPNIVFSSFVAISNSHTVGEYEKNKNHCEMQKETRKKEKHREIFNPISSFFLFFPSILLVCVFNYQLNEKWSMEGRSEHNSQQWVRPFQEHLPCCLLCFKLSFKCEITPETHCCRTKS